MSTTRRVLLLAVATAAMLLVIDFAFVGIVATLIFEPGRALLFGFAGAIGLPGLMVALQSLIDKQHFERRVSYDRAGRVVSQGPWRFMRLSSPLSRGEGCGIYPMLLLAYAVKGPRAATLQCAEIPGVLQGHWRLAEDLGPNWPAMRDLYFSHEPVTKGDGWRHVVLCNADETALEVLTIEIKHVPRNRPQFRIHNGNLEYPAALQPADSEADSAEFVSYAVSPAGDEFRLRLRLRTVSWSIASANEEPQSRQHRIRQKLEMLSLPKSTAPDVQTGYVAMSYVDHFDYPASIRKLQRLSTFMTPGQLSQCMSLVAAKVEQGFGQNQHDEILSHARTASLYEEKEWWFKIAIAGTMQSMRITVAPFEIDVRPAANDNENHADRRNVLRVAVNLWVPPALADHVEADFAPGERVVEGEN
jgi:hypothetical protein